MHPYRDDCASRLYAGDDYPWPGKSADIHFVLWRACHDGGYGIFAYNLCKCGKTAVYWIFDACMYSVWLCMWLETCRRDYMLGKVVTWIFWRKAHWGLTPLTTPWIYLNHAFVISVFNTCNIDVLKNSSTIVSKCVFIITLIMYSIFTNEVIKWMKIRWRQRVNI